MGLCRQSFVPMRLRRKCSIYTSLGLVAVMLFVASIVTPLGEVDDGDAGPRRLSLFPNDPLIASRPYDESPRRWLIFVHIILIGYMLLGLNAVCDIYFSGALEVMVEQWNVKPDVAGATFMAAGGSAPEFFTSMAGAFLTNDDVGFSTIVGSAVFNVLFVIGLCGFMAGSAIQLSWWPLFRDCSFYVFGLAILLLFSSDEEITLWEAIGLFVAYLIYLCVMYNNDKLEALTDREFHKAKKQQPCESEQWASPVASVRQDGPTAVSPVPDPEPVGKASGSRGLSGTPDCLNKDDVVAESESSERAMRDAQPDDSAVYPSGNQPQLQSRKSQMRLSTESGMQNVPLRGKLRASSYSAMAAADRHDKRMASLGTPSSRQDNGSRTGSKEPTAANSDKSIVSGSQESSHAGTAPAAPVSLPDDDEADDLMEKPEGGLDLIVWYLSVPIYVPIYYTTPKPSETTFKYTFLMSLCWIAVLATFMIWWVEVLGEVLGISNNVMGLTLLAAGTSIPDAVSSVAVAKVGQGDMAISSSIGSNIFDILVGLPIPWMLKIGLLEGIVKGRSYKQRIQSPYMAVYVLLLLIMVASVVAIIHFMKWRLDKKLGIIMTCLYVLFIVFAVVVEATNPTALQFDL